MSRVDLIPATILTCCVLHNICLRNPDDIENYILEGRENDEDRENFEGNEQYGDNDNDNEGVAKRNYLATLLYTGRI